MSLLYTDAPLYAAIAAVCVAVAIYWATDLCRALYRRWRP